MSVRKQVCIIVDAYSTANKLSGVIDAYGYPCVHVQSNLYIPSVLTRSFKPQDFIDHFIFNGNLEKLLTEIKEKDYQIKCVITGAESGVVLSDFLADWFHVVGNKPGSSLKRRDKFLMAEALNKSSIRHIKYIKAANIQTIFTWQKENDFDSIVIKPLSSSGTFGFHICRNEEDIKQAFHALYNNKDIFGDLNQEVLVQEYIEGQEYCVNIVSYQSKHYVSEIWKTDKKSHLGSKVYDLETLISENSHQYSILKNYTTQVLEALEIEYGASHTEIIIDDKTGLPFLIESAARFMGSLDVSLITEAYGTNVILLTAEAYLQPAIFLERVAHGALQTIMKFPAMVQLISHQDGVLSTYQLNKLKKLKTFHGIDTYLKPGDMLKKTIDSYSSPGLVFLSGESKEEVYADYQMIRSMEKLGSIYILEGSEANQRMPT